MSTKSKIHQLLDGIEDEAVLTQVMEEIVFYSSKKDVVDDLSSNQIEELDAAIEEVDRKETISWSDFKKDMDEWRKE